MIAALLYSRLQHLRHYHVIRSCPLSTCSFNQAIFIAVSTAFSKLFESLVESFLSDFFIYGKW